MLVACTDRLQYQGQDIQVHRGPFLPYQEECRNHSITLDPATALRVERLLLAAPIPDYLHARDLPRVMSELRVPGYGLSGSTSALSENRSIRIIRIEAPCRGQDRIVTFLESSEGLDLIDDFAFKNTGVFVATAELDGATLTYRDPGRHVILTRQRRQNTPRP
jgi:hypothetical protein